MADPNEKVQIEHPDLKPDRLGQPFEVTRANYENLWKGLGWRLKKKEGS